MRKKNRHLKPRRHMRSWARLGNHQSRPQTSISSSLKWRCVLRYLDGLDFIKGPYDVNSPGKINAYDARRAIYLRRVISANILSLARRREWRDIIDTYVL